MYKPFLSLRFFRSRFLTLAAFLSTMFGVAMLFIVQSVMGGYMSQLKTNIRGQEAHLRIIGYGPLGVKNLLDIEEAVKKVPHVRETAPFIERLAVYRSGVSIKPVTLVGIDPVLQAKVSDFSSYLLRPGELEEILRKHHAGPTAVDMPLAIDDVHALVGDKDRLPLSDGELRQFFDLEWRIEILEKYRPLLVKEFPVPPAGIIVGVQSILDRQLMLGQILTVVTLSPDTGGEISERFLVTGAINTGDFQIDSGSLFADVQKVRNLLNRDIDELDNPYRYQGIRIALDEDTIDVQNAAELEEVRDDYEFIVVDCPPSLGLLTVNALTAADSVLIPVQCEYYALEGLSKLLNSIQLVQRYLNPSLAVEGVLLTMYDERLQLSKRVTAEVKSYFGDKVYDTVIKRNVSLAAAPSFGKPVILFEPRSSGAENYSLLAGEVGSTQPAFV